MEGKKFIENSLGSALTQIYGRNPDGSIGNEANQKQQIAVVRRSFEGLVAFWVDE